MPAAKSQDNKHKQKGVKLLKVQKKNYFATFYFVHFFAFIFYIFIFMLTWLAPAM